jgi:hypothetical protein
MFFQKYKKIIMIIVVLVLVFIMYTVFFAKEPEGESLLVSTNQGAQTQIVGNEIVAALNQIQTLKLSREIFEDPIYKSLVDRSIPIPQEPVGKSNPFSPIGSNRVNTSTTTRPSTQGTNTLIDAVNRPPANLPVI